MHKRRKNSDFSVHFVFFCGCPFVFRTAVILVDAGRRADVTRFQGNVIARLEKITRQRRRIFFIRHLLASVAFVGEFAFRWDAGGIRQTRSGHIPRSCQDPRCGLGQTAVLCPNPGNALAGLGKYVGTGDPALQAGLSHDGPSALTNSVLGWPHILRSTDGPDEFRLPS
jgi:hypothetical protein